MIQITLRPIDGSSPSEERIQRPERPQRANRPPGNTSPLQSFIIRAQTGQSASGREEIPRPNAPVQDENYNNRSISPLFANQASSATAPLSYNLTSTSRPLENTENPCEMQPSRPQLINVGFTQAVLSTSTEVRVLTAPEFPPENNHLVAREDHQDQLRQHGWSDRGLTQGSSSVSGRGEENMIQTDGGVLHIPRRNERQAMSPRQNRSGNIRDEAQERSAQAVVRNNVNSERERRVRMPRSGGGGVSNARNYSPPELTASDSPSISRQAWEMWTGVGGLPRRPLRREHRLDHNGSLPPLINLVEGEDEQENPSAQAAATAATSNLPVMAESEPRWISLNMLPVSQVGNPQNLERRTTWIPEEEVDTTDDSINVLEDEEDVLLGREEEECIEDNEVLMSVPPEFNRDQQNISGPNNTTTTDPSPAELTPVRQSGNNDSSASHSRNSDISQKVLLALECPVCLDYVAPPIAQCYQGHLVCNKCRLRLDHCPECRGPFSAVRPRTVEKIASFVNYPCSNEGCAQSVAYADRVIHAKSCNFRSFMCPISPLVCSWTGQKSALRNHILNFHGRHLHWINNSRLTFHIQPRAGKERVFIMETMHQLFLVKFIVAPQDKLRGCVTLLGYDLSRIDSMIVIVMVCSADRPSPCLMVTRAPAEENDEMDMRLEKFAVFNISQLIQNSLTPSPITVKISIGRTDILKQVDRIFE